MSNKLYKDIDLLGILREITDSKVKEPINRQFFSDISHELRAPLTGIMGFAHFLKDTPLNEEQKEYVEYIRTSAHMLHDVVNNILDYAELQSGKVGLREEPANLYTLCSQVIESLSFAAKEKGVALQLEYDPTIPDPILIDASRFHQILSNLIRNAVKHTFSGYVKLDVKQVMAKRQSGKATLHIEVRDTGTSGHDEEVHRLFQSKENQNSALEKPYTSSGLSILIAKKLLELMNAQLEPAENKDRGTTLSFDIELRSEAGFRKIDDEVKINQASRISLDDKQNYPIISVMLVEDEKSNMMLVKKMIAKAIPKARVIEAFNGREAVQAFYKERPQLILMDVQMPVMDGLDATRAIRKIEEGTKEHATIIALTAAVDQSNRNQCIESGMDKFIGKPIIADEFYHTIHQWMCQQLQKTEN